MTASSGGGRTAGSAQWIVVALCWAAVGIPLAWGVWMTVKKAMLLFQ